MGENTDECSMARCCRQLKHGRFLLPGNLYYENAVNGFLNEMFSRWKSSGASHEMTIVLFSRCFYNARDKSEFPPEMFECLQMDRDGRFYEDFYRVVVQVVF